MLEKKLKFKIGRQYLFPISAKNALLSRTALAIANKPVAQRTTDDTTNLLDFGRDTFGVDAKKPGWVDNVDFNSIQEKAKTLFEESRFESIHQLIINDFIPNIYSDLCKLCRDNSLKILQEIKSNELPRLRRELTTDSKIFANLVLECKTLVSTFEEKLKQYLKSLLLDTKKEINSLIEALKSSYNRRKFPTELECFESLTSDINSIIETFNRLLNRLNNNLTDRVISLVEELQNNYSVEMKPRYVIQFNTNILTKLLDISFDNNSHLKQESLRYNFSFDPKSYIVLKERFGSESSSPAESGEIFKKHPFKDQIFCRWYQVDIDLLLSQLKKSIDSHFDNLSFEKHYNFNHLTAFLDRSKLQCDGLVKNYNQRLSAIETRSNELKEIVSGNSSNIERLSKTKQDELIQWIENIKANDLIHFSNINFFNQAITKLTSDFIALKNQKLKIAVIGTGKSGKSTFINSLIGERIALSRSTAATILPQLFEIEAQNLQLQATSRKLSYNIPNDFTDVFKDIYDFLLKLDFNTLSSFSTSGDTAEVLRQIESKTSFSTIQSQSDPAKLISIYNDLLRILLKSGQLNPPIELLANQVMSKSIEEYPLVVVK